MKYDWNSEEIEALMVQLDDMRLPFKKYSFAFKNGRMKSLGSGGFSYVYEGVKRGRNVPNYAIKVIGFQCRNTDYGQWEAVVKVQKNFTSFMAYGRDNIIELYEYEGLRVWMDEDDIITRTCRLKEISGDDDENGDYIDLYFAVLEKCEPVFPDGKNLYPPQLARNIDEQYRFAYQIGYALECIHSENMIHADVKLENVFYSKKRKKYKLGDFGISQFEDSKNRLRVSYTAGYAAPEMIGSRNPCYDKSVDMYSLGVMMFLILNRMRFPGSSRFYDRNDAAVKQYTNGYVFPDAVDATREYNDILQKMCSFYPEDRYSSIQAVLDDFEKKFMDVSVTIRKGSAYAGETLSKFCGVSVLIMWAKGVVWAAVLFAVLAFLFTADYTNFYKNRNPVSMARHGRKIWYIGMFSFALLFLLGVVFKSGLDAAEFVRSEPETLVDRITTPLLFTIIPQETLIKIFHPGLITTGKVGIAVCLCLILREKLRIFIAKRRNGDNNSVQIR